MTQAYQHARQLVSTLGDDGLVRLSIREYDTGEARDDEVIVRVEASPINPSDLGLLFAAGELATLAKAGDALTIQVPPNVLRGMSARIGQALPAGNEGGGVVVAAGVSPAAQALLGKTVGVLGGGMYAEYRRLKVDQCLALLPGTTAKQGASCFVNPLTALGMVDTMRMEGHQALVHTAAASNLGQMLQKICLADGVPLVNIVRKPEQAALLRGIGATYVVDSSQPTFMDDLTAALVATDATIGFDATGGGTLASNILSAMEAAQSRKGGDFNRYGSSTHKQVYIYGGLERAPTTLTRNYGMAWGLGGWLLTPFLQKAGPKRAQELRERVAREINTTFASHYSHEISLAGMLDVANARGYGRMATGEKYLVLPQE
ncbi:MAG: zinc-binding dehydrogenase [Pseudomonadales bacterium]|nr:zinc-binding dehydrogenase [Pseudomonadales bacterium]